MDIADSTCVALTTYRRDGAAVTTPVWITRLSDGRVGFYTAMGTGKTKRLKRDPRLTLQPCGWSGRLKRGTSAVGGTAQLHQGDQLYDETMARVMKKYGLMGRFARLTGGLAMKRRGLTYADTAVVVRLDD
jgi:PPOX class probable F420-dependent enzyme